jgi:DNA-directed RNA polymerase specialized sigma24 family protein
MRELHTGDWGSSARTPHKMRRAIEETTDGLPQGHREALLLNDVAGLDYEEIASYRGAASRLASRPR